MKRGDIYVAELFPRSGSEQTGRRPIIVVSHDSFNANANWRSIIVVPVSTSANRARRGPTAILLDAAEGGLSKVSTALCHQVTTLDRTKLKQRLGTLTSERMLEIERGLKAAMDMG